MDGVSKLLSCILGMQKASLSRCRRASPRANAQANDILSNVGTAEIRPQRKWGLGPAGSAPQRTCGDEGDKTVMMRSLEIPANAGEEAKSGGPDKRTLAVRGGPLT